jgi:hypothetical protein
MKFVGACFFAVVLTSSAALAQSANTRTSFPAYMQDGFDFANFTRFDAPGPPKTLIYQSNGYLALQEQGFGGQRMIVPVAGAAAPTNKSDRLLALEFEAPVFVDSAWNTYRMSDSPAKRSMTYYADRTVYRAAFTGGPEVALTVYPIYGKSAAVLRIQVVHATGPLLVTLKITEDGFKMVSDANAEFPTYGSSRWPYRSALSGSTGATSHEGTFEWTVGEGENAALTVSLGATEEAARSTLDEVEASPDLLESVTHRRWNDYLASAPLVAPEKPLAFTIGTSGQREGIEPEDLVRSELWNWRGLLNITCQAKYLPGCPMMIADWYIFMGMWGNDGIAEAVSIAATDRKDLARASLLSWFRYAVNTKGDGTAAWTIFPSGNSTFSATGPERNTQSVPMQASLVGEYVRMTGDTGILNERPGGVAGDRTVWQALVAYQKNLRSIRDWNHDHLIDWSNTYETGWDDKNSPFIDLHGHATSAINEQVDQLWSLEEMKYLAKIQGADSAFWDAEFTETRDAVRKILWDKATQRYWDLDATTGKLWTQGENLDAYYFLYFEDDPARIAAMMKRLNDPAKFNGALLPTMAFDTPKWGGYWRGPAWPREFSFVALGLSRSGHTQEGFSWLARAINSDLGPLLAENTDPKAYPPSEHAIGEVRIMGHDTLDALVLPDIAGLRTWGGDDLSVVADASLGKVYVRGQKWMGDSYDALFEPGKNTRLWRNGIELGSLSPQQIWRARKRGDSVTFEPVALKQP